MVTKGDKDKKKAPIIIFVRAGKRRNLLKCTYSKAERLTRLPLARIIQTNLVI